MIILLAVAICFIAGDALAGNHSAAESAEGMSGGCNCSGFGGVISDNVVKMLSPGGFSHNEPGGRESASGSFAGDHGMLGHI